MVGIFIGVVLFILVLALISSLKNTNRRRPLRNQPLPENLGIKLEGGLTIVNELDKSLPTSYEENVKNRVLRENPRWKDHEFDWAFFELKRYFVMNSLLKSVPMFSEHVDEVWHEMLMFTRDYDQFSKKFYGEKLHHMPNLESTPIPGERAFFDWVYLSLFESTANSRSIWGGFLKHPIKREVLDDFRTLSRAELLTKYFRSGDDWLEEKTQIIEKLKREINDADIVKRENKGFERSHSRDESHIYSYALGAAVFYSLYEEDQFESGMSNIIPNEYYKTENHGGGSSCSGFSCSSGDSGHDSGGGDGGGSSCSSCGGGCGGS
ncbi:hypothetical protein [Bacillus weihaiensis]|uniref:hypothetical protein n=1 Tax=Bacillus weihaiensis TaxID=1547283 RepID=UPI00235778AB|nr:hypothetical protein [Bacillus weihaiensis]